MKDVLYGVKLVILEEISPTTQLPVEGGVKCRVNTAESAEMEAVTSEGSEDVHRTDDRILAVVRTPDLMYGYNLTLTDNTFDPEVAALIEGGVVEEDELGNIIGYRSPFISEGSSNMKPFRAMIYVANYEGDSIKNYVVITLNNCSGSAPGMNAAKEFYAPEYAIKAREATKAGLPIKSLSYVDTLPAAEAPTIASIADIGEAIITVSEKTISGIPTGTKVSELLEAIVVTRGGSKKVVDSRGYDVTTGELNDTMKVRTFMPTEISVFTEYSLSFA